MSSELHLDSYAVRVLFQLNIYTYIGIQRLWQLLAI